MKKTSDFSKIFSLFSHNQSSAWTEIGHVSSAAALDNQAVSPGFFQHPLARKLLPERVKLS
ncbi:MAG TPA: hypothetical protein VHM28_04325, partial [Anaerolineales bacterium]|nr:hypothetical protein [Anaerolineales bacterium]